MAEKVEAYLPRVFILNLLLPRSILLPLSANSCISRALIKFFSFKVPIPCLPELKLI